MAATIDRTSIRKEIERIESTYQDMVDNNQLAAEQKLLFQSMLSMMNMMAMIFMEKTTRKNSKNSSIPSSQSEKDETSKRKASPKKQQEKAVSASNHRVTEIRKSLPVSHCDCCGEDLQGQPVIATESRQKIDLFFEKHVLSMVAEIKACPGCKSETRGKFPADMPGSRQFGAGVKAYAIDMLVNQMVSLNRLQKQLQTLMGETLSEATLLKYVAQLYDKLEPWEAKVKAQLAQAPVLNVDETTMRVDKKNQWVHVTSWEDLTLKFVHKSRGREAMNAEGVLENYQGVLVHDCWASYFCYDQCLHGLCGSHLLRELQFVIDSNQYRWAVLMKKLLQETCKKLNGSDSKCLEDRDYKNLLKRYRNILTRGINEMPEIPDKPAGKRGKMAKPTAHNLHQRFVEHEASILLFAKMAEVPFTNNRAERDLRMGKVKQKVSGCFRTEKYAAAYCRISSYLMTMKNKGYNPIIAVQMALAGECVLGGGE